MRHHDCADHARGHPPTRSPAELLFAFTILKLNPTRPGEILAEEMRRARLDRFEILRHRFDRRRLHRARKFFALGFFAGKNRNGAMVAHEGFVNVEHLLCLRASFRFGLVNGVTFLPEELRRAQKQTRPHFPANDVGPLIN